MNRVTLNVAALPLGELRALRAKLQADEDALSYVRRIAQARIDFVKAERDQHLGTASPVLTRGLSTAPAGTPRPPRTIEESSSHPLAVELDEMCARLGAHRVAELTPDEIDDLLVALQRFELERSVERQDLFAQLDLLSAELVRRYRDGEASVDGLLDDE